MCTDVHDTIFMIVEMTFSLNGNKRNSIIFRNRIIYHLGERLKSEEFNIFPNRIYRRLSSVVHTRIFLTSFEECIRIRVTTESFKQKIE